MEFLKLKYTPRPSHSVRSFQLIHPTLQNIPIAPLQMGKHTLNERPGYYTK